MLIWKGVDTVAAGTIVIDKEEYNKLVRDNTDLRNRNAFLMSVVGAAIHELKQVNGRLGQQMKQYNTMGGQV